MHSKAMWDMLAAQQLVRYEALFKLLDDIQDVDDIQEISDQVAAQWKYISSVSSWHLVIFHDRYFLIIDGYRGKATLHDEKILPEWDAHYKKLQRPYSIPIRESPNVLTEGPLPPAHLIGRNTFEIRVLPLIRKERWIALLSVSSNHEPFSELDMKFLRTFGVHFADKVASILFRKQVTQALMEKATHDALTGLYNRGAIIEKLNEQLLLSQRMEQPFGIILADIDYFKKINDSFGHLTGDLVLREVSKSLQSQLRSSDYLGRYGGEEFLFILFPCSLKAIETATERFRKTIADLSIQYGTTAKDVINITISLGASSNSGCLGIPMDALLKQADDALYQAKANGRNCWVCRSVQGKVL